MPRSLAFRLLLPHVLLLLLGASAGWVIARSLRIDSSAGTLLASDPRSVETFDKIGELLPGTELVLVVAEHPDLFSDEGALLIADISDRMLSVSGCEEVKSLTHSGRPIRRGLSLDIEPFIPLRATPKQWEALRDFATRFPLSRNVLVSADARYAVFVGIYRRALPGHAERLAFRDEFHRALEGVASRVRSLHVLSFPFIEAEAREALAADLRSYLWLAAILIPAILLVTFRCPWTVAYVLMAQASGLLLLVGLFTVLGQPVDLYTGILFPLTVGVQLTFVIHHASAIRRHLRECPPRLAAARALRETAPPAAIAALTTIAGLLALALSDLPHIAAFGRVGALAVGFVYVLTFLPPALWAGPAPAPDRLPAPTGAARLPPRTAVVGVFALLTLVMLAGVFRVRTDVRAAEFIRKGEPLRRTLELLNQDLGGMNVFQLEVDGGAPYAMQTAPVLRYLEALRQYARTLNGVSDAYAYSQLYIALNQIWDGDTSAEGSLPSNPVRLGFFSTLLNNSPLLFKDAFVNEDASRSLLVVRSRDMPGRRYLELLEDFMARAESTRPPGVTLRPVHGLHSVLEADRRIVRNQIRSLGVSLLVIWGALALFWRSLREALWVLLANLPALATIFGAMGFLGFPLNSVTVMVAAVLLGVAVDDGIHLVAAARAGRRRGLSPAEAAVNALREKLRPMACTTAILVVFFGLLMVASFPPVGHFGLLAAAGLLVSLAGAALLLPALLAGFQPRRQVR